MDYFQKYLDYVGHSESPIIYHRWTSIAIIAALLCRNIHIPFGHSVIYPNMYLQLMGAPGTRKSTAISIGKKLLKEVGYHRFAPDRMSKERFLMEMAPPELDGLDEDLELLVFDKPSEIFVVAEEFGDFMGMNNMEFLTMLTKLWDNMESYTHPKIHGKSVEVFQPTVNILSGNTIQGLALTIPPEGLGNGFMSRVLFIYAEETGIKITFPIPPNQDLSTVLVDHLKAIKELKGVVHYHKDAKHLLDRMYKEYIGIDDHRFKPYGTRRFTHLLKLCMIFAAADLRTEIREVDTLKANTLLHHTELNMPKALGEFGRSRYADVSGVVLSILDKTDVPLTLNELWKFVNKDLNRLAELGDLIRGLLAADKIQVMTIAGKQGYMPLHQDTKEWSPDLLIDGFITPKEFV